MTQKRKIGNVIASILKYAVLIFGAIFTILPFVWMILSSLKTPSELNQMPPVFFPAEPQWVNYQEAWKAAPFARYFVNTLIVTACTTCGVLVTTVLSAFAFSRLNFPGKKTVFSLFLATLMIPGEMLIITNYETIINLKWIDSYKAMIIPWISSAFYIYLLTRFFMQVPESLYLAAKVDKCSDFKYMMKIMVPMNKQAIFSIAILNIISSWNAFLWPLLVTNSQEMRVLSNGLVRFQTEAGSSTELIMAASCMLVMPIIIIYLFLRKYIIEGVTRSGLKG
ncbi:MULTISPECIES: carbohydrate ABC transporter permease [unclassified Butyrivibrio]|jgi:multiple sugar transport system permease protein|uniref:carbohydrate ABC transporter permease n=1 Tax=unclassified Butyrivibrio TaxID=2639466 RepID=UPI00041F41E0|nr:MULTISPECIES: carbohydrate ABC transporter permease [unclassified Butyrivibrio]SCX83554.1 multiple sugar transport system permease protein [Butyrivibrio sp. INlla14]